MLWQSASEQVNPSKTPKMTFSNMATLTFDLIWSLYLQLFKCESVYRKISNRRAPPIEEPPGF